jgi:DNA-binding beta-propeller fold protein YncE
MNKLALLITAAVLLPSVPIVESARCEEPCPTYLGQMGTTGAAPGQLDSPYGIGVGGSGDIYVADSHNDRIQVFSGEGAFMGGWGSLGTSPGQFNSPTGLHVVASVVDTIYVADLFNRRVQKFTEAGVFLTEWGQYGLGTGEFISPLDVATDSDGYVYVADVDWTRIQKFTPTGSYVSEWGEYGFGDGQFEGARGIAIDALGLVFVTDYAGRVQVFDSDGVFLYGWGSPGSLPGEFGPPVGIDVDLDSNRVYVADLANARIQVFSRQGTFLCTWGVEGTGIGELMSPRDVCIVGNEVIVSDSGNDRLQRFVCSPATAVSSPIPGAYLSARPNPFGARTVIDYEAAGATTEISIYDVRGRHVRTLVEGRAVAGAGSVAWDGTGARGEKVPAGVYFVRMVSGVHEVTRRIVLLR